MTNKLFRTLKITCLCMALTAALPIVSFADEQTAVNENKKVVKVKVLEKNQIIVDSKTNRTFQSCKLKFSDYIHEFPTIYLELVDDQLKMTDLSFRKNMAVFRDVINFWKEKDKLKTLRIEHQLKYFKERYKKYDTSNKNTGDSK